MAQWGPVGLAAITRPGYILQLYYSYKHGYHKRGYHNAWAITSMATTRLGYHKVRLSQACLSQAWLSQGLGYHKAWAITRRGYHKAWAITMSGYHKARQLRSLFFLFHYSLFFSSTTPFFLFHDLTLLAWESTTWEESNPQFELRRGACAGAAAPLAATLRNLNACFLEFLLELPSFLRQHFHAGIHTNWISWSHNPDGS